MDSSILSRLTDAIKTGNRMESAALTAKLIEARIDAQTILNAMVAAMDDVGQRFKNNEIFVPDMLIAARAMKQAMALFEPVLVAAGIRPEHTTVVGTVQGDLHDIGKNLVAMMLRGSNFNVIDLGSNVAPEKFVTSIREHNAQLVGLSALLTTTMPAIKTTLDAIRAAGLDKVKVMIGGAPVTQGFADEIGADGYAPEAASAVDLARHLVAA